jgi:hypothetical protein
VLILLVVFMVQRVLRVVLSFDPISEISGKNGSLASVCTAALCVKSKRNEQQRATPSRWLIVFLIRLFSSDLASLFRGFLERDSLLREEPFRQMKIIF